MVGFDTLINIGQGSLIGIGFGLLGWFKNQDPNLQPFDGEKFLGTILTGALAGGILGYEGINLDFTNYTSMILTITAYGGAQVIIERIAKAVWRYFKKPSTITPLIA
jgi:hypothetical protein